MRRSGVIIYRAIGLGAGLILTVLVLWPSVVRADFDAGVQHFKQGRYSQAIREFKNLAELGHIRSLFNVGLMYDQGWGVARDPYMASTWYRLAAMRGDPRAQYNLGLISMQGRGVELSYSKAEAWFLKAADQDYARAQHNLGIMYYEGLGKVERNYDKGMQWLHWAKMNGFKKGRNDLTPFGLTVTKAELYERPGWEGLIFPLTDSG